MGNMGDPAQDYEAVIAPFVVGGGIFDFSGTQAPEGCYTFHDKAGGNPKVGSQPTPAEIQGWTAFWWDGSSDEWTSDEQFQEDRNKFVEGKNFTVGGNEYRIMKRVAFGDNDSGHVVIGRSKNTEWKTGCLIAHSDYTCVVGIYDEDERQTLGNVQLKMVDLMKAYKTAGF